MSVEQRRRKTLFYPAYAASLALGAGMLFILSRQGFPPHSEWPILGVFFLFLMGAETRLSESHVGGGKVMSSKPIMLAVVVLFGPAPAALMEACSALLRGLLISRRELHKVLFNAAMLGTAAGTAGLTYHALPLSHEFSGPQFLLPLLAAMLAHTLVNNLMMAVIMSLDARVPVQQVYRRNLNLPRLRNFMDPPLAAMIVLLYLQAGWWTLLLCLVPVLVLYQSDKLFQRMREAHINSIAALTTALEADEPYTHGHSYRVSKYAVKIGRALSLSDAELETLEYGGLLHDIGKIAINNDIICKPGRLTADEFATMKTHPTIGADIVEQIRFLRDAADLVRHHHERPDGKGYPHGLRQGEISLGCHILNVCDALDAMTSDRPYRKALTLEEACEELVRNRGTQFDERVVDMSLNLYHRGEFDEISRTAAPPVLTDDLPELTRSSA